MSDIGSKEYKKSNEFIGGVYPKDYGLWDLRVAPGAVGGNLLDHVEKGSIKPENIKNSAAVRVSSK